jgi:rubrerythrin
MTARPTPLPGHPVKAGAGYDCGCSACLATPALRPGEWACRQCGAAYFATPPDDTLCPTCRPLRGAR